jgi:tellurite resistance protein TerC
VKLVLEALHENNLPFINGGEPVPVPTVGIELSLGVIVGVLAITTIASLVKAKRDPSAVHAPPISIGEDHSDKDKDEAQTPGSGRSVAGD